MKNLNDKSRNAYNKKADHYDSTFDGRFTQEFKNLLTATIVLPDKCSVLDVACGNGSLLFGLNKIKSINGFGIDIADRMIENAATLNPDMKFQVSGCEAMPFQDESMDIITVCAAYHHFPDVVAFAKEAKRILKPEGKLYIAEVYLPSFLRFLINPFVPLSKAGDVRLYSPLEIVDNFKKIGFQRPEIIIAARIQIVSVMKPQRDPVCL